MTKKIVCMLLVCVLLAACLPVQVFASVSQTDAPAVSATDAAAASLAPVLGEVAKEYGSEGDVGDNNFTETENNNTRSTADLIGNDYTVSGNLHRNVITDDNKDYFKIKVNSKSAIEVIMVASGWTTGAARAAKISILNASGGTVAKGEDLGEVDYGSYGDYIGATLSAGTYYILVSDTGSTTINYTFYVNWVDYNTPLVSGSYGNLKWAISRDGVLTLSGSGDMPDAVYNESAGRSNAPWAEYAGYVESIVVKDGITSIGSFAFTDCYFAEKVTIADSVAAIGEGAFWCCENITSLALPDSLEYIGASAFEMCTGLTQITVPAKTNYIGIYAFTGCSSMTKINVESGNTYFCSVDGVLYDKAVTTLVACPGGKTGLRVADGVTAIANAACYGCEKLTTVLLGSSLEIIGAEAFAWCTGITGALSLPDTVTGVGEAAFYECNSLTAVYIPAGVVHIGDYAFCGGDRMKEINVDPDNPSYCSIDGVLLNKAVDSLLACPGGKSSFDIPASVGRIEAGAFLDCTAMTRLVIPKSVTYIGVNSFSADTIDDCIYYDGTVDEWNQIEGEASASMVIPVYCRTKDGLNAEINRLADTTRTGTAALISQSAFESAENVILANGDNYADALAGGALAYALDAPILLVRRELDETTAKEIERLGAENIYILGGEGAVSGSVAAALASVGYNVERIAGEDRFDTAVKIAEKLCELSGAPEEVYFAYSHNYPDALAISGVAAIKGCPVLYISGKGELSESAREFIESTGVQRAYILGGTGVISADAESNILAAGIAETERIAGADRMETCMEINAEFADLLTGDAICIATAYNYPDALAGGVFAAINRAPMLLVHTNLSYAQGNFINAADPEKIYIFGGSAAVSNSIEGIIWTM